MTRAGGVFTPRIVLALLTSVTVAALALFVMKLADPDTSRLAIVGLTEDADNGRMFDSNLALVAGTLDDGTIVSDAQRQLGLAPNPEAVTIDRDRSYDNSIVAIIGHGKDATEAASLANTVADLMVERTPEGTPVGVLDRAGGGGSWRSEMAVVLAGLLAGLVIGLLLPRSILRTVDRR